MSKVPWRDDGAERDSIAASGMWLERFRASLSMCSLAIERCHPPGGSPPLSWSLRCEGFFSAFIVDLAPGTANAETAKAAAVAWLRMEASRLTKQLLEETEWSEESPVDRLRQVVRGRATRRTRAPIQGGSAGVLDVVWPDGTRQRLSKEVSRELWRQFHAAPSMTIVLKDEE